jgi:hypothetical protein
MIEMSGSTSAGLWQRGAVGAHGRDASGRIWRQLMLRALAIGVAWCALGGGHVAFASPCGGSGQRACCAGQGQACQGGSHEVGGCTGDCRCDAPNPFSSSGHCVPDPPPGPCGGPGQRACCVGQGQACQVGFREIGGCTGDCRCFAPSPLSSSGHCVPYPPLPPPRTPCGGLGQRACCAGQGNACQDRLHEVAGCTGDCRCFAPSPLSSSGHCMPPPVDCGGQGQRPCGAGERPGPECNAGLENLEGLCLAITACGGEGQRQCCLFEKADHGPCDAGLSEGLGVRCTFKLGKPIELNDRRDCACRGHAALSIGGCTKINPLEPTGACYVTPSTARTAVAMQLYVAGFNHSRPNINQRVHQDGVNELVSVIANSPRMANPADARGDNLVIAFSESNAALESPLDGGPRASTPPLNGQAVAFALENRFKTKFTYTPGNIWGPEGGQAVITGPGWIPTHSIVVDVTNPDGARGHVLEVRLQLRGDPATKFTIYLVHASGDPKTKGEIDALQKIIKLRAVPGSLAPMIVGDFNMGFCDKDENHSCNGVDDGVTSVYVDHSYLWANKAVACSGAPETAGITLSTEHNLMHILTGGCPGDLFSSYSGRFVPVYQLYSRAPGGKPAALTDGIRLPHAAHNVIGMGFNVERGQRTCPARPASP